VPFATIYSIKRLKKKRIPKASKPCSDTTHSNAPGPR